MNHKTIRNSTIASTAAALLLLGWAVPANAAAPGPEAPDTESDTCAARTGERALEIWGPELRDREFYGQEHYEPRFDLADPSTYDPCADLSWILVPYGTGESAQHAIMLFNDGRYVGTASWQTFAGAPDVERTADGQLDVTYRYHTGVPEVDSSTFHSTFTWDEASQSVLHEGEFPFGG